MARSGRRVPRRGHAAIQRQRPLRPRGRGMSRRPRSPRASRSVPLCHLPPLPSGAGGCSAGREGPCLPPAPPQHPERAALGYRVASPHGFSGSSAPQPLPLSRAPSCPINPPAQIPYSNAVHRRERGARLSCFYPFFSISFSSSSSVWQGWIFQDF